MQKGHEIKNIKIAKYVDCQKKKGDIASTDAPALLFLFLCSQGTEAPPSEKVVGMFDLPFNIKCYTDQSFSGQPLAFPANVTRGQDLFCKVRNHLLSEAMFHPSKVK